MSTGTSEEIEEERRLLYVAMTRARDHLHLMLPQRFHVHQQAAYGDRHVYASRSRFITGAVAKLFESCAWPVAPARPAGAEPPGNESTQALDISARVRAIWA
jgi:DNA helicase-2/ATP-dependent DNA helicase PcrA